MKEFIEKLIGRLEEESHWEESTFDEDGYCNDDAEEVICLHRAIEIVNQLAGEYNNGWISCKEKLPEEKGEYLVCDDDGKIHESTYYHNMWLVQSTTSEILAWMPLPTPYKESEEK